MHPTNLDDFKEFHATEPERLTFLEEYTGMLPQDFTDLRKKLDGVKPIVDILQHNRNVYLVHLDVAETTQLEATYADMFKLIETAEDILSLLTKRLDMNGTTYQLIDRQIEDDADGLMKLLREYNDPDTIT